jgi:hypothetical protein
MEMKILCHSFSHKKNVHKIRNPGYDILEFLHEDRRSGRLDENNRNTFATSVAEEPE